MQRMLREIGMKFNTLNTSLMKIRTPYGSVTNNFEVAGMLDEFISSVDDNDLECIRCNKHFASMSNKIQHACKVG